MNFSCLRYRWVHQNRATYAGFMRRVCRYREYTVTEDGVVLQRDDWKAMDSMWEAPLDTCGVTSGAWLWRTKVHVIVGGESGRPVYWDAIVRNMATVCVCVCWDL